MNICSKEGCNGGMEPIPGYEDLYSISRDGKVWSHRSHRLMTHQIMDTGHHDVVLTDSLGHTKLKGVHVLILLTYEGLCPDGCEASHEDDNKDNNALSNLKWRTRSGNMKLAALNGKKGKLSPEQVLEIRRRYPANSMEYIAREFNVSKGTIRNVVKNITYTHPDQD